MRCIHLTTLLRPPMSWPPVTATLVATQSRWADCNADWHQWIQNFGLGRGPNSCLVFTFPLLIHQVCRCVVKFVWSSCKVTFVRCFTNVRLVVHYSLLNTQCFSCWAAKLHSWSGGPMPLPVERATSSARCLHTPTKMAIWGHFAPSAAWLEEGHAWDSHSFIFQLR